MKTNEVNQLLEANLATHLNDLVPKSHELREAYFYACLPAGKLFRPKLAIGVFESGPQKKNVLEALSNPHSGLSYFCSAIEIHHAYTLVHDDLPAMDNDDMRRGKLSTHKKFGQWQAILVGDGLLNISYTLLASIAHPHSTKIIRLAGKMLGPRGLIHGQVLDLSHEMNLSFQQCRETHFNKTARLIQFSLLGAEIIKNKQTPLAKEGKKWLRFGESLGLLFQFLDDLTELSEESLSVHESEINPWISFGEETLRETIKQLDLLTQQKELIQVMALVGYFEKIHQIVINDLETILSHLKKNQDQLGPVITRLNVLGQR